MRCNSMATLAASYPSVQRENRAVPKLCRVLLGDWGDVKNAADGKMGLHVTIKAHGSAVVGSIHLTSTNKWYRMEITPAWFCARGLVYERRDKSLIHVATLRLCHRRKERSVFWQVVGRDQSSSLPPEAILWMRR